MTIENWQAASASTHAEEGTTAPASDKAPRRPRGFAAMSPEKQREIARKGGQAAHARGTAHRFDADEARAAGRKGGAAVSQNRSHMAEIGRAGGLARRRRPSEAPTEAAPPEDKPSTDDATTTTTTH